MLRRFISSVLIICLAASYWQMPAYAQDFSLNQLPVPGTRISPTEAYMPLTLKGLVIHPENALKFDFLMDTGKSNLSQNALQEEALKIMKYFLTAMTVPEEDLWVNLSPYEKGRVVQDQFGQTLMGRDLLAQDYILKQLTASLIYPEDALGKKFWSEIYQKAAQQYGTTQIPVNTFNKVWIVPSEAAVWQNEDKVMIVKSRLKVMLEEDYLSMSKNRGVGAGSPGPLQKGGETPPLQDTNKIGSQIVRELVLPVLEKEVNEGEHFAQLRQMYQAMILATWYKRALKQSILNKVYADQKMIKGVDNTNTTDIEGIYQQYVKAFKKGAFNYIKEDIDPVSKQSVPHKYFSGGFSLRRGSTSLATALLVLAGTLTLSQQEAVAGVGQPVGQSIIVQGQLQNGDGKEFIPFEVSKKPTEATLDKRSQKAIEQLSDVQSDRMQRLEALRTLKEIGNNQVIIKWAIYAFQNGMSDVRAEAEDALIELGPLALKNLIIALVQAEKDKEYIIYNRISKLLYEQGFTAGRFVYIEDDKGKMIRTLRSKKGNNDSAMLGEQASVLMAKDFSEENLKEKGIDVLMIPGNDDINVFKKVLDLKARGIGKYILISGGIGRLTQDLKRVADANGLIVEMSSEANMIRSILIQLAQQNADWKGLVEDLHNDDLTILEDKARFTVENFLLSKEELKKRGLISDQGAKALKILYIQKPIQQLRAKGNFYSVFRDEIARGLVEGISFTSEYISHEKSAEDIVGELFRIIVNGQKGDWQLNEGYGIVPDHNWSQALELLRAMEPQGKEDLVNVLLANVVNMKLTKEEVLHGLPPKVEAFAKGVFDYFDQISVNGDSVSSSLAESSNVPDKAMVNEIIQWFSSASSMTMIPVGVGLVVAVGASWSIGARKWNSYYIAGNSQGAQMTNVYALHVIDRLLEIYEPQLQGANVFNVEALANELMSYSAEGALTSLTSTDRGFMQALLAASQNGAKKFVSNQRIISILQSIRDVVAFTNQKISVKNLTKLFLKKAGLDPNRYADAAMSSDKRKILFSETFKDSFQILGGLMAGLVFLGVLVGYNVNADATNQFFKNLALKAYEVFGLVLKDPNSYKIVVVGTGLTAALLAWQNYSIQGLNALFKSGTLDSDEVIQRLKNKGKGAVKVLLEYYRQHFLASDDILDFLIKMNDKRAIEPIADALSDGFGDIEKQNQALKKLGADKEIIFLANIKALLHDSEAIKFLVELGDARAINPIASSRHDIKLINDALVKLGADKERIFQFNIKALLHDSEAIKFLVELGDARAINPIASSGYDIKLINDALIKLGADRELIFQKNIHKLGQVSIEFLGNFGDKRAIQPILNVIRSGDNIKAANEALNKLGANKEDVFQANLFVLLNSSELKSRRSVVQVLEQGDILRAADIAFSQLVLAENEQRYPDYNKLSDLLHQLGDQRRSGSYEFDSRRFIITSPEKGHYENWFAGEYGGGGDWVVDEPEQGYWTGDDIWKKVNRGSDLAILGQKTSANKDQGMKGGIDFNQTKVQASGKAMELKFDSAQLAEFSKGNFQGFTPVIINIAPVNLNLLLGLNQAPKEDSKQVLARL